jgi:hypothetical protein
VSYEEAVLLWHMHATSLRAMRLSMCVVTQVRYDMKSSLDEGDIPELLS